MPKSPKPPARGPLDLSRVKTYPLRTRRSKVRTSQFGSPWQSGGTFAGFLASLPDVLAVKTLRRLAKAIAHAHRRRRPVIFGLGAHPTKVGLNPILVDLMDRGIITAVAMSGAVVIHDFELAYLGQTSEDVDAEIDNGRFGMAEETGRMINEAIIQGDKEGQGIGEAVGRYMNRHAKAFRSIKTSLLAKAATLNVPATVHVAIGTDIIHMHPLADGAALGAASLYDFHKLTAVVSRMEGGVYVNVGSAVLLPEVFLKTVTLSRNLGRSLRHITTANLDFLNQYRPTTNVLKRPTQKGGVGYALTGHHEIMLPLLAAAILEELDS
ncbi:MAG: hypothetical protein GKS05_04075 [Nitrospirales bacterium]|nr:hypothetical protein [Nitrospirales bacterium]